MMRLNAYSPSDLLKPFIKAYVIIESQDELVNKVLPDTAPVLAFRYKGSLHYIGADDQNINLPASSLSGLRSSLRLFGYSKNTGNILVIFKEAGASAFFKEPLHELFGVSISLDHFLPPHQLASIEDQLSEARNNGERVVLVERFLMAKLCSGKPDAIISAAVAKIHSANGVIKISQLASLLYISQDAFEKRFRRIIGTSPKHFSSIVRMQSLISRGRQEKTLTGIGLDAGYFDQAHFNKAFKQFTLQAPADFFRRPAFMQINDFLQ